MTSRFTKGYTPWNKAPPVLLNCLTCGKEMRVPKHRAKRTKCCSKACLHKRMSVVPCKPRKRVIKTCIQCDKTFDVNTFRKKKAKFCSKACTNLYRVGKPFESATKFKKGMISWCRGRTGELAVSWKGGVSRVTQRIRRSMPYKNWQRTVRERDVYCQACGAEEPSLDVHHIEPFSSLLQKLITLSGEENIRDKAVAFIPLWDTDNGVSLCKDCHRELHLFSRMNHAVEI